MITSTLVIAVVFLFLLGAAALTCMRHLRRLEERYRSTLETAQRTLDEHSSRLNILSRALPGLRAALAGPSVDDAFWKTVGLDEARALIWADGACYWRYIEKDDSLELDVAKGAPGLAPVHQRMPASAGPVAEAVQKRLPVAADSELFVPLVVLDELRGLFQFRRSSTPGFSKREEEFASMFIGQIALALENREMAVNRERFYLELVQTLADALDSKDSSTKGQSRRARELARGVARELDLPEEFSYYLEFAALMHDIGKIGIDESVLRKPGKLTAEEFEQVKKHPELGHRILAPVSLLAPVAPMVLYHQEWFNGQGYPDGLAGEEIPLGARIVAILDAWSAMTSDRPWRKALTLEAAIQELRKGAGTQFDPRIVEAFLATLKNQGVGTPA